MSIIKRAVVLATVPVLAATWVVAAMGATPARAQANGEACVFSAPSGVTGVVPGDEWAGHVGWGFLWTSVGGLPGGNWEFGANEGPSGDLTSNTWFAGGWGAVEGTSRNDMLAEFKNGGPYEGAGFYESYKCVTVPNPNPSAADTEAGNEYGQLYAIPGQDCESQVYNVLKAYGVSDLPNDLLTPDPNSWYNDLTTQAGFGSPTPLNS